MTTTRPLGALLVQVVLPLVWCLTVAAASISAIHETGGRRPSTVLLEVELEDDAVTGEATEQQQQHDSSYDIHQDTTHHHHYYDYSTATQSDEECGVWLAPSTIPGAGLGMFAGKNFAKNDVLVPTGDSVIGIVDIGVHNRPQNHPESFLWDEYTWSGKSLRLNKEGREEVNVASAGFGAAVNCFLPIVNADELNPVLQWDGLQRMSDPGAGASTQFHGRLSVAKRPIAAGEEFFVSYGEDWFTSREHLGPIPLYDDLNHASSLLHKFSELSLRNATILDDLWHTFITPRSAFSQSSRVLGAFRPNESPFALLQLFQGNLTAARIADSQRGLDWLRAHGTCGDHLVAAPSTLPQAGHGAFAARNLTQGTVVAQLPLIHVTNRSRFNMYHLHNVNKEWVADETRGVVGQQLLLNYCFGHRESTMLLCPYGPMTNYINHNQSAANVRLRWGRSDTGNHMPALLNVSVAEIAKSDSRAKLAMELVATRDIGQGEEILMDYGGEWQAAWEAHVASWQPPLRKPAKSAAELNNETKLRTIFEEYKKRHYPFSVELFCDTLVHNDESQWKEHYAAGTLKEYLADEDAVWWPCEILRYKTDPTTGQTLYTTHMFELSGGQILNSILVEDVPREIFHFVDPPYSSDTFLPSAFRHDIRIPDELFPKAWRNLLEE